MKGCYKLNYLICLKYDGSNYHGWQRQQNAVTVQQKIEESAEKLFGEKISVSGCSRTDTGVHANCFFCNFHANKIIRKENIISGLNHFLPDDIAVTGCEYKDDNFNARFDCVSKQYVYKIYNGKIRDPFSNNRAYFYKYKLDENLLNEQARDFIGTYDFTSFRAVGSTVTTTVRTVKNAYVTREGDYILFFVEADGFLYNMVRIMVGTLIYISENKIEKNTIKNIIDAKDRSRAGMTAPPEGLYLNKVFYEKN